MISKLLPVIFILALVSGCSSSKGNSTAYRTEANAYCWAHTPEYWIESGRLDAINAMRPTEKAETFIKEFRSVISSEEMASIVFDEGGKLPADEFYPYLQKKIPELTKEPFDCPAIPAFYITR